MQFDGFGFLGAPQAVKFTPEGGLAVRYLNGTGGASVKGTLVAASTSANLTAIKQTNEYDTFGVVYEDGVPSGAEMWVVIAGKAQVLLEDGTAATRGNLAVASDVDGRADCTVAAPGSGIPAVDTHFKEIGHCLETENAGANTPACATTHQ